MNDPERKRMLEAAHARVVWLYNHKPATWADIFEQLQVEVVPAPTVEQRMAKAVARMQEWEDAGGFVEWCKRRREAQS